MKSMTESLKEFCEKREIPLRKHGDTSFKIGFVGDTGTFDTYINIYEEEGQIVVRTLLPVKAPLEKLTQACEILMLANGIIHYGNFELCFRTGFIAFKTTAILGRAELHEDINENLVFYNWMYTERFFPAINAVLFADITPKDAIETLKPQERPQAQANDVDTSKLIGDRLGKNLNN